MTQASALGFEFAEKLASLQEAILSRHPTMPTLLQDIHRTLKQYPEQVTLMSEDEIAVVVSGLMQQTQTSLVKATVASASKASANNVKSKIAQLGLDAI